MWGQGWRDTTWSRLTQEKWDVVIIGGGITGAGILHASTRMGLKSLLLEKGDFASGTSSRSSKFVHGGIRYLRDGHLHLTRISVQERERLLREAPGLVEPIGFLIPLYKGGHPGRLTYKAALSVYDWLGTSHPHNYYDADAFLMLAPFIKREGLIGGFRYLDAQTDDARLVLRLLREASLEGATVLNYASVTGLVRQHDMVRGVQVRDLVTQQEAQVMATAVINATGVWVDDLRRELAMPRTMRPLRGSHLVFPHRVFPAFQAITFNHPDDHRPIYAYPWEGATVVGTTDLDHTLSLDQEPRITPAETDYLLRAVQGLAPGLNLSADSITSTYAGIRPIVDLDNEDPSRASREFALWQEKGLLTVTGGKLTAFSQIAVDVMKHLCPLFPALKAPSHVPVSTPAEAAVQGAGGVEPTLRRRLIGRYGPEATAFFREVPTDELAIIPDTHTSWAEVRWAARHEGVIHLTDLLLRRVRIGVVLPEGGRALLSRIKVVCQQELGWSDAEWDTEVEAYTTFWDTNHTVPTTAAASKSLLVGTS